MEQPERTALVGGLYAAATFTFWGLVPLYFKTVGHVPADQILAQRAIWSAVLLAGLLSLMRRWPIVRALFGDRRQLTILTATTLLMTVNWFTFIWAIEAGRVLEISLGYYINPLVSILLGMVFLRERHGRWQALAILLAAAGVGNLALQTEGFPWVSLSLAVTFGFYGLLRKIAPVRPIEGLFVETMLMSPFALVYLLYLDSQGSGVFGRLDLSTDLLLVLSGVMTATPLIWFASAARRLRLSTVGFFQYIAPTGHFLLAVFLFGERFTDTHLVTFACIWTALAIYSLSSLRRRPEARQTPVEMAPAARARVE
ncbi:MAG: EamA family transporter RarD [Rhodovibrionaceae bacterium]